MKDERKKQLIEELDGLRAVSFELREKVADIS